MIDSHTLNIELARISEQTLMSLPRFTPEAIIYEGGECVFYRADQLVAGLGIDADELVALTHDGHGPPTTIIDGRTMYGHNAVVAWCQTAEAVLYLGKQFIAGGVA